MGKKKKKEEENLKNESRHYVTMSNAINNNVCLSLTHGIKLNKYLCNMQPLQMGPFEYPFLF